MGLGPEMGAMGYILYRIVHLALRQGLMGLLPILLQGPVPGKVFSYIIFLFPVTLAVVIVRTIYPIPCPCPCSCPVPCGVNKPLLYFWTIA